MSEFKEIDPSIYADWSQAKLAQKTAQVMAEFVEPGTVVETIMADGHVETFKTAGENGGYRVINPTGEQYLVDPEKFETRYEETKIKMAFKPKWDPTLVLPLTENVSFTASWGEEMLIKAGGVLVNSGSNDIYGIQPEEFKQTYSYVDDAPKQVTGILCGV